MSALNRKSSRVTHEGGSAYARDRKQELFFAVTTGFAGLDTFYETGEDRDKRVIAVGREIAVSDWTWYSKFLPWLRAEANIRTMSVILAAEGVHARLAAKQYGSGSRDTLTNRQLIANVLQRPDEPGEMIAYWINHYGKRIPQPVKRGVADAVTRMLNQRQALRYDKTGDVVRLGDVLELTHPRPRDAVQGEVFAHLITARHNRDGYVPPKELTEIRSRWDLNKLGEQERDAFAAKVKNGDPDAVAMWKKALAGQWEWGRSWLG